MISSRRFFFPESCVRQFAETSGKDTFTAWASSQRALHTFSTGPLVGTVTFIVSFLVSIIPRVDSPSRRMYVAMPTECKAATF
jgi:hypothetical protein